MSQRTSRYGSIILLTASMGLISADAPSPPPTARTTWLNSLGVRDWHEAGSRGQGQVVAILDSGFRGYRSHLSRALPAQVKVRSFRNDGNLEARDSQHGILCAEIVHALAPEATLLLANWEPDHPDRFLAAVRWARAQGANLFTCSVIMPTWSDGDGGGPIHPRLREALDGAVFFACAGNTAERHWIGEFRAGAEGFHEWQPGQFSNLVRPYHGDRVSVDLCWNGDTDYEVRVLDTHGRTVAKARSDDSPTFHRVVAARWVPSGGESYRVQVRRLRGLGGRFHLVALGATLGIVNAAGSIPFPGDGAEVVTVGAMDATGRRMHFSSCGSSGPTLKPDLMAVVPVPSQWRARPFSGTSAAAPQAAGLAALCWQRHPTLSAERLIQCLREAAEDHGPPGPDPEFGHGRVRLPPR